MSSYLGRHAALYDMFYAEKPYAQEAEFIDTLLKQHAANKPRRLLELACGTGKHALELEKRGYDIIATDYSPDMLACAKGRATQAQSKVQFHHADMRHLAECEPLAGQAFDAAYALFDSIGYVQTNEAIAEVLRGVHDHLKPGGVFIFEFWHAAAMLRDFDPLRVRRWKTETGEVIRISRTTLDVAKQLSHIAYEIIELQNDGKYNRLEEMQTNRYFLVQEMAAFITSASLTPITWHAGFSPETRIDETTWHVIAVAQRPP
jgi:SAM-dependent methyltransferase